MGLLRGAVFHHSGVPENSPLIRTSSTTTRDRNLQFRGAVSTGGSPLDFLLFFSSIYVQFSKTSPQKSGESSEKSSGENRVKSCHVCGCHGFFGSELSLMCRFPSLMGRFPTLMGRFPECLNGPFSLLKIPWKTAH